MTEESKRLLSVILNCWLQAVKSVTLVSDNYELRMDTPTLKVLSKYMYIFFMQKQVPRYIFVSGPGKRRTRLSCDCNLLTYN